MVTRLWKDINDSLPSDCRALVYGTPALVQPETHRLLAVAFGTQYIIRVASTAIEKGLPENYVTVLKWSNGKTTDLADFGPDWVAGKWRAEDLEWCAENFLHNDVENA
jgi:hypothetical protein